LEGAGIRRGAGVWLGIDIRPAGLLPVLKPTPLFGSDRFGRHRCRKPLGRTGCVVYQSLGMTSNAIHCICGIVLIAISIGGQVAYQICQWLK
jgi:hypothetical protein